MKKYLSQLNTPIVRHEAVKVIKDGELVIVRIMLIKYDGNVEVYYQEDGYPFEFAYGVADSESITKILMDAQINVYRWGLHYDE